jgi:hypothetical protein
MQVGAPAEEDLRLWGHHSNTATVPDEILRKIGAEHPDRISFVFTCQVTTQNHAFVYVLFRFAAQRPLCQLALVLNILCRC